MIDITVKYGFSDDCKLIRQMVFVDEQGFKEEFDSVDNFASHIVLYDGEKPIATGRAFPSDDENVYIIGRIAVVKDYRSKHIGSYVVNELTEIAKQKGAKRIKLSAQFRIKEFYERLGYKPVGETYYDEDCLHQAMIKDI